MPMVSCSVPVRIVICSSHDFLVLMNCQWFPMSRTRSSGRRSFGSSMWLWRARKVKLQSVLKQCSMIREGHHCLGRRRTRLLPLLNSDS